MFLSEELRALPMPPLAFGLVTFTIFSLLLYLTLRIDRD